MPGVHTLMVVDESARQGFSLPVRFAALTHDLGKATTPADILPRHHGHEARSVRLATALCERLRVPNECRDLALLAARYHGDIHRTAELRPSTLVTLLERTDALRRPERFQRLLEVCQCDFNGRLGWAGRPYESDSLLLAVLAAVRTVDAGAIAVACADKAKIPGMIYAARVAAVKRLLDKTRDDQEEN